MVKKYTLKHAKSHLPSRNRKDNKTRGGKTLIVAGSRGMWGAAILCAMSAARGGAGYTYVYDPAETFPVYSHPDFLILKQLKNLAQFSSVAIGPGYKNQNTIQKLMRQLSQFPQIKVVLDAEALNTLSKMKTIPTLPTHWILTPHEGELARLLKVPSQKIQANRKMYVSLAQKKLGCIVILKGFKTLIATSGSIWEITSGNPSLAKAGTGDVLTGLIAAFLGQNLQPIEAACLATFIHGHIADRWIKLGNDQLSLLATDMIDLIAETLNSIRKK